MKALLLLLLLLLCLSTNIMNHIYFSVCTVLQCTDIWGMSVLDQRYANNVHLFGSVESWSNLKRRWQCLWLLCGEI